jgi:plastocyanin
MRKFTAPLALSLAALTFVCVFADTADAGLRKRKRRGNDCDTCAAPVAVAPACNTCGAVGYAPGYGGPVAMPVAYAPAPCGGCPQAYNAYQGGYQSGYQVMGTQSFYQPNYQPNGVTPAAGYIPSANVPNILPANATEVRVRLTDSGEPAPITVPVGTTVRFVNDGKVAHTVASTKGDWTSNELAPGQEFTATFTQPGTFEYHCGTAKDLKAMKGTIVVK